MFGIMKDSGISAADSNMLTEYMQVVQFLIYPMMIVLVAFLLAVGILPKIGPLKRLSKELKMVGLQESEETEKFDEDGKPPRLHNTGCRAGWSYALHQ